MSSTSNAQDLLVNVFRPTYRWDSNTGFVPSLVVSNVTELIAGSVKADRLAVTDLNLNTYIGCNAGGGAVGTASNVALGYNAMGGAVNSSNNVAVGMFSLEGLLNSDCNVALGARTDITGEGLRNVLIGPNVTMGDGSGNIFIGVDISAGNVSKRFQLGTLLYGDLSSGFVGINTSAPTAALDISGIVVFRNKVGFQNPDPTYSLDVAGSVYASEQFIGSNGTSSKPLFTFEDASGSGMYVPESNLGYGVGAFAIAVNQSPAAVFSSNAVNFFQNLDVSGTFSACNVNIDTFSVVNGTAASPAMTFTNDTTTGLFLASSNRLGVSTGGVRRMEVLSNGDVSFGHLVTRDISYSGTIVGSDPTTCNVIGGVVLCNGYVTTTGTSSSSNLVITGFIRNSDPATQLDLSGGNISNSGTTRSSNFRAQNGSTSAPAYSFVNDTASGLHLVGTSTLGFDTTGVQRMCISGSFVGIGTPSPRVTLDVSGDISANVYNGPGGTQTAPHYTFSDDRTTGLFFPGANMIGLTAGGVERMRISNSNIGIGTRAPSNALDVSGTLRVIGVAGDITFTNGAISIGGSNVISATGVLSNGTATSNSIGGVTLSNTNISLAGTITGSTANTNNSIGGVILSNSNVSNVTRLTTTNAIVSGYLRNALTPSQFDISGGNISNSNSIQTGNPGDKNLYGVLEIGRGYSDYVTNNGIPGLSFQWTGGGFRHFVATRHSTAAGNGNAIDFFLNTNSASNGSTGPRTGNSHVMSITGAGIGIGTTAPGQALDVSASFRVGNSKALFDITPGGSASEYAVTTTNGYFTIFKPGTTDKSEANKVVNFSPEANAPCYILSNYVGFGHKEPRYFVDISTSISDQGISITAPNAQVNVRDRAVSHALQLYMNGTNQGLYTVNTLPLYLYQNGGARLVISNSSVGIATLNPRSLLDIGAEGAALRIAGTDINTGLLLQGYSNESYIRQQTGALYMGGGGYSATLTLSAASRVGINQAAPAYPLDVSGSARITGGLIFSVQSI